MNQINQTNNGLLCGREVERLFSSFAGRYDLNNTVISLGVHHLWKKRLAASVLQKSPKRILDLCTGTGDILHLVADAEIHTVGVDFCRPMLRIARQKRSSALRPPDLIQADGLMLPFADGSFDVVVVAFGVRNFENLMKGLNECSRLLKSGGSLFVLEFGRPGNFLLQRIYSLYLFAVLPLLGTLVTGNRDAFSYFRRSVWRFPCGEDFAELLCSLQFDSVSIKPLTFGISYLYSAVKI